MEINKYRIILIFVISALAAGNDLNITGEVRYRSENFNNFNNALIKNDVDSYLRTRLNMAFEPINNVGIYLQFQNSRLFGEETSTLDGSADNIDLHQGFISINNLFDSPLNIDIGRYEVNYGNERLIGGHDWHNVGRSFDGITIKYENQNYSYDLFDFRLNDSELFPTIGDKRLLGINTTYSGETYLASALVINDSDSLIELNTADIFFMKKFGGAFIFEGEFALQDGRENGVTKKSQLYSINLSVYDQNVQLNVGYEFLSGDNSETPDRNETFNPLYGSTHKFNGFMDNYSNIPQYPFDSGLENIHLGISELNIGGVDLEFICHIFNPEFRSENNDEFGIELDFTFEKIYNEYVTFSGGCSRFSKGHYLLLPSGDFSSMLYFSTTVRF